MAMRKLKKYKPTKFKARTSHYDKEAADYAVNFIQCLCHTKGTWAGKPFELIDWQEQIVRDLFGILKKDGYRQFNTAYVEIPKKQGKQVSLDTLIPTPSGFTTMGEIKVGDTVFDETGLPCHVVAKSQIDFDEQAYRIVFKDGEVIEAGENHQWIGEKHRKPVMMTTGELYRYFQTKSYSFRIAVNGALETPEAELPVDPYLMGYWLGNGNAIKPEITVRTSDVPEVLFNIQQNTVVNNAWLNVGDSLIFRIYELKPILLESFHDKVIPPEYLRASKEQRLRLLQGLMDSVGGISGMNAHVR